MICKGRAYPSSVALALKQHKKMCDPKHYKILKPYILSKNLPEGRIFLYSYILVYCESKFTVQKYIFF